MEFFNIFDSILSNVPTSACLFARQNMFALFRLKLPGKADASAVLNTPRPLKTSSPGLRYAQMLI